MLSSSFPASRGRLQAARYVSSLRAHEILVLQGSPLLGAVLALGPAIVEHVVPLAILIIANVCLVAHIFALNDWANLPADRRDPNRLASVFTIRGVAPDEMGTLTAGLFVLSLVLFSQLGFVVVCLATGIAALSALYSLPRFNWKGRPVLSSAAHLAGGVLHFLLGYSVGSAIDRRALVTSLFFGLTFAAGHLMQELRDYRADALNTISTNAVSFGPRRTFAAGLVLFGLAHAHLFVLAVNGTVPLALGAVVLLYPFQLRWSLQALADGLTTTSVTRLQIRYRALYAIIGVAMVTTLLLAGT